MAGRVRPGEIRHRRTDGGGAGAALALRAHAPARSRRGSRLRGGARGVAKGEEVKANAMIEKLYEYYLNNVDELPEEYLYLNREKGEDIRRVVCDYIAGMSDQYSVKVFQNIFVPRFWEM